MEGITVPITTPGADASARALQDVAAALGTMGAKAGATALSFNEVRQAVTSLVGDIGAFANRVAALSSEQSRLDANSARLALNFNAAADAAGRFTDETDAMAAATRLAEAGIRLSQEQLEALTRVAGNFAQNTGVSTHEAVEKLTMGLMTGAQEGLRPFGGELRAVAGETRTAEQRLAALTTQAQHTTQATDDAASAMDRLRDGVDDASRAMASGFTDGLAQMAAVATQAETAGTRFEILTEDIRNAGRIIGQVVVGVGNGLAIMVGGLATGIASMLSQVVAAASAAGAVIDRVRSGHITGLGAAASGAYATSLADSPITAALARFTEARVDAGERILDALGSGSETREATSTAAPAGRTPSPRRSGSTTHEAGKSHKADLLYAQNAEREQRRLTEETTAALIEQHSHATEIATVHARIVDLQVEENRAAEVRLARARSAQSRAEGRIGQEAELADLRDPAVQQDRIEAARQQRTIDRERRALDRRIDLQRSFTERMRDQYEEQTNIAREGAEGVARTFTITADALTKHAEAWAAGRETIGDALQGMLSDVLTSIGKESFVKSAFFFAKGLGDLASYNFPGAAQDFAASAAYGVVGGLATAAGAAVAPSAAPSASGASTAPAQPAAKVSKGGASGSGGEGTIINVAFGGPMYGTGGVRRAAREIAGVLNGGARQGGVQLMPGALMGGGSGS